jgi:tetratricopeptide (TPR) repeat protein
MKTDIEPFQTLLMPVIVALAFTAVEAAAQNSTRTLWDNPVLQKRLMGSFGFDSAVEPSLSENEQVDHDRIIPLVQDDPERALQLFATLRDLPGSSARFDFLIGNIHFQKDRKPLAMESFQKAIEKFPTYRQAHNNLAILYSQTGQAREAIRHFTEAIKLGSADGTSYGLLGVAYISTENYIAAEEAFRSAMVLSPEVKDWEMGLLRALYSQEKFTEVISMLDRMVKIRPEDNTLWMLQANAYLARKEPLAAAANYEVLDRMGKLPPEALTTLGDIYVNEGLLEVAADVYLRGYDKNPAAGVSGPLRAAEVLLAREGFSAARNLLGEVRKRNAREVTPEDTKRMLKLEAKVALAEGQEDESAKLLQQIVEKDPLDGESLLLLGQHFQREGNPEKAIFYFETAAGIEASEADAKVRHAQLLVGQGKYQEAIPLLKRAQEVKPRENVGKFLEDLERFMRARR